MHERSLAARRVWASGFAAETDLGLVDDVPMFTPEPVPSADEHRHSEMTSFDETKDAPSLSPATPPAVFVPTIVGHGAPVQASAGGGEPARTGDPLLKALLSVLGDLLFAVDKGGIIRDVTTPPDAEFPLSSDEVVGHRITELLPGAAGDLVMHYLERALRSGSTQIFSCQHSVQGKMRIFEGRIALLDSTRVLALVRDVTDRQTLENEMIENSHRVQLRIGQDLHDSLGQHLTGISFLSRALEKKLSAQARPEAEDAAEVSRLVLEAISQTRQLARGLFPAELENRGLLPALRELAANVEEACGIVCRLECSGPDIPVAPETAMHLYRLAQEAINNAVKHGKARRVTLRLLRRGECITLCIEDDGVGLPANRPVGRGLGLRIMNYRAQKIGGQFDLRSNERGGTTVSCSFALSQSTGPETVPAETFS